MNHITFAVAACLLLVTGCASGDDPETVALLDSLAPEVYYRTAKGKDGIEHIVVVGVLVKNLGETRRREVLGALPHLDKLAHLATLKVGGGTLVEDDLKLMPPLPNLKEFLINADSLADEGLKYFASMKNLEKLTLHCPQIRGPGLAYLKDFSKLEWLELRSTSLDDTALPHIVANFKNLKRLSFNNDGVKITPDGVMQLAEIHWLLQIGLPNDFVGPNPSDASNREEKSRLIQERQLAKKAFYLKFNKAYLESNRKARAAGIKVPYGSTPFYSPELQEELQRQAAQRKPATRYKGWTNYPAYPLEGTDKEK